MAFQATLQTGSGAAQEHANNISNQSRSLGDYNHASGFEEPDAGDEQYPIVTSVEHGVVFPERRGQGKVGSVPVVDQVSSTSHLDETQRHGRPWSTTFIRFGPLSGIIGLNSCLQHSIADSDYLYICIRHAHGSCMCLRVTRRPCWLQSSTYGRLAHSSFYRELNAELSQAMVVLMISCSIWRLSPRSPIFQCDMPRFKG